MRDSEPVLGSLSGAHCVKNNLCLVHSRLGRVGRDKTKKPTDDTHTGVDAKSKTKYTKKQFRELGVYPSLAGILETVMWA